MNTIITSMTAAARRPSYFGCKLAACYRNGTTRPPWRRPPQCVFRCPGDGPSECTGGIALVWLIMPGAWLRVLPGIGEAATCIQLHFRVLLHCTSRAGAAMGGGGGRENDSAWAARSHTSLEAARAPRATTLSTGQGPKTSPRPPSIKDTEMREKEEVPREGGRRRRIEKHYNFETR